MSSVYKLCPSNEKWCFSENDVIKTPSSREGITTANEILYRREAALFIQETGQKLKLSQLAINSAIVYVQRFYMYHSFSQFDKRAISLSALFLSAKIEEQPRKTEHVIKAAHAHMNPGTPPLHPQSKIYKEKCQELVLNENFLLSTLGFDFVVEQPSAYVVHACGILKVPKELAKTAYALTITSLHLTTMCLKCSPKLEACVCLSLACEWIHEACKGTSNLLPEEWYMKVLGPSWEMNSISTLKLLQDLKSNFSNIIKEHPSTFKRIHPVRHSIKRPISENSNKSKKPKDSEDAVKPPKNSPLEAATITSGDTACASSSSPPSKPWLDVELLSPESSNSSTATENSVEELEINRESISSLKSQYISCKPSPISYYPNFANCERI